MPYNPSTVLYLHQSLYLKLLSMGFILVPFRHLYEASSLSHYFSHCVVYHLETRSPLHYLDVTTHPTLCIAILYNCPCKSCCNFPGWYASTDMSRCTRLHNARKHDKSDTFRVTGPCSSTEVRSYKPQFMIDRTLFVLPTCPVERDISVHAKY